MQDYDVRTIIRERLRTAGKSIKELSDRTAIKYHRLDGALCRYWRLRSEEYTAIDAVLTAWETDGGAA